MFNTFDLYDFNGEGTWKAVVNQNEYIENFYKEFHTNGICYDYKEEIKSIQCLENAITFLSNIKTDFIQVDFLDNLESHFSGGYYYHKKVDVLYSLHCIKEDILNDPEIESDYFE